MKKKFHRLLRSKGFLIFIFCIGLLVLVYPLISDRYYQIQQKEAIQTEESTVDKLEKQKLETIREQADDFNHRFLEMGGEKLFDAKRYDFVEKSLEDHLYPSFFLDGQAIGSVEIPKLQTQIPIYFGTDDDVLEKGTGYMPLSSLPVGKPGTHTIITGHRGLPQSRLFRDLGELVQKDIFLIRSLGEIMAYEVDDIAIIEPTDFSHFIITPNEDYCTLLTCHPYMINSERLIVRGHRVPYTPELQEKMKTQQRNNRLRLFFVRYREYFIGIGLFLLLVLIAHLFEKRRRRRNSNELE